MQKNINDNKPKSDQEVKELRQQVEEKGEYTLHNVFTTEELLRQNESKAKEYYGDRWYQLNNESKAILIASIIKDNTPLSISKYNDFNINQGIFEDDYKRNLQKDPYTTIESGCTPIHIYNNELAENFKKILNNQHPSKYSAFCKKDKELLLSNNIPEEDIELYNCVLMGTKNAAESDISGISSYFSKYTLNALHDILLLRIKDLKLNNLLQDTDVKVFKVIFTSQIKNNITEIVNKVSFMNEKIALVPLNLYGNHASGLVFEKLCNNTLSVKYFDPLQEPIPLELKRSIISSNANIKFDIEEIKVEQQSYTNCGPEVIENFVLYLTGHRVSQEKAIELQSKLVENALLDSLDSNSSTYFSLEKQTCGNSLNFDYLEQNKNDYLQFHNFDYDNLQLEVAGDVHLFH